MIFYLYLLVLVVPRIYLIPIGDSGVRIEDMLVLLSIGIVFFGKVKVHKYNSVKLIVIIYIVSSVLNYTLSNVSLLNSLLYSFKVLEIYIIYYMSQSVIKSESDLNKMAKLFLIFSLFIYLLQSVGLSSFNQYSLNRFSSTTGGPYELAFCLSLISIVFIYKKNYLYLLVSLFLLLETGSRISLLATLIGMAFLYVNNVKDLMGILMLSLIVTFVSFDSIVFERILEALTYESYSSVLLSIKDATPIASSSDYRYFTYGDSLSSMLQASGDSSMLIRFTRWSYLIKTTLNDYVSFFIGLGPGYAGKAIDGMYTRIFVESGFVSLIIFLLFIVKIFVKNNNKLVKAAVIIFSISGLFIDIFFAIKAMTMFWLFVSLIKINRNGLDEKNSISC